MCCTPHAVRRRERRSPDRLKVGAISRSHLLADGTARGTAVNCCTSATINSLAAREFNGVPRDVLHAARRAAKGAPIARSAESSCDRRIAASGGRRRIRNGSAPCDARRAPCGSRRVASPPTLCRWEERLGRGQRTFYSILFTHDARSWGSRHRYSRGTAATGENARRTGVRRYLQRVG